MPDGRSDLIARAAADLRGLVDASDERRDAASAAGQLKAYDLVPSGVGSSSSRGLMRAMAS